jgi:hypothetical protein
MIEISQYLVIKLVKLIFNTKYNNPIYLDINKNFYTHNFQSHDIKCILMEEGKLNK